MHAAACGLFLALALSAGLSDLRWRRLPNWLTVTGTAAALVVRAGLGPDRLLDGILGMAMALLVGLGCFAIRALGAGDAKLIAAFGAWFGLPSLAPAFVAMTGGGALLALAWSVRHRILRATLASTASMLGGALQGEAVRPIVGGTSVGRLPYGVGISAGAVFWWIWTGCGIP